MREGKKEAPWGRPQVELSVSRDHVITGIELMIFSKRFFYQFFCFPNIINLNGELVLTARLSCKHSSTSTTPHKKCLKEIEKTHTHFRFIDFRFFSSNLSMASPIFHPQKIRFHCVRQRLNHTSASKPPFN